MHPALETPSSSATASSSDCGSRYGLTPDTTFFLNRAGYQDALNVLLVALRSGEGFVKVVGEVGTGKTLLCRKLINTLGDGL